MRDRYLKVVGLLALVSLLGLAGGCQPNQDTGSKPNAPDEKANGDRAEAKHVDHSGWWCPEHGIPEEVCSMCSAEAAEKFKAMGDWCDEHDRADSQCFICHPELKERFAAQYRAKYGEDPPPIGEELDDSETKP